jgi:small acid-soluble spore protein F (minor alpha/beta-type SASP)
MANTSEVHKRRKSIDAEEEEKIINEIKLEIAEELGLLDIIKEKGWSGLSAQECGRIGGKMVKKLKGLRMRE